MEKKKPSELGELLDQVDAAPLLYVGSDKMPDANSFGACVSCGGKCYNGCKATTMSDIEYNLPNKQPSLDRERKGDREVVNNGSSITYEKTERVTYDPTTNKPK